MQCLQVIDDVRINDAAWVVVGEQNQGPTVGRRVRRHLLVRFTDEAKCVAAEAVTQRLSLVGGKHPHYFLASAKKSVRVVLISRISRFRWHRRASISWTSKTWW